MRAKKNPAALAGADRAVISQAVSKRDITPNTHQSPLAVRFLGRRYALRAAVALIIAEATGLGSAI